ncbi:hypothetical protein PR048_000123 [Dryococelus australis]|uniref:Uncharacterized protein n=1 Tax=Dryococelus australis TaxID=614101 RepID=A0ABQ9IEQ0_9NEOP|nr:hypothetical protein PR048_000123 [Dryococelus australis]
MDCAGNKIDREDREIPTHVGEDFAQRHNMYYLETSAKEAENVEKLFMEIAAELMEATSESERAAEVRHQPPDDKRQDDCHRGQRLLQPLLVTTIPAEGSGVVRGKDFTFVAFLCILPARCCCTLANMQTASVTALMFAFAPGCRSLQFLCCYR